MKESGMIARLAAAVVFLAMAAEPAVAADDASAAPLVEFARVLKHPLPVWPGMVDREALVILRFDVLSSGKTANIQLVEGGFHEQRFVNAAINAVKRYTFAPKRIDGTPVDTQGITQAFRFDLKLEPGITPDFRRELVKVGQLLDRKDYEGAHFHAEWMVAEKVKLGYEYAVLQAQLAETYSRLGQTSEAIFRAYKATQRTGKSPEFLQLAALYST